MKTNKRASLVVMTAAFVTIAAAQPARLSAETGAKWSVEVKKVDSGNVSLAPSFQIAIYESLLEQLGKTKQFKQVLRDGDRAASNETNLLLLKTTVEKYTAGSETRRAVTTISGATKLTVRTQLTKPDGEIILARSIQGNVRFMGSNLRATHNLARNIAKEIKKTSLPRPPLTAIASSTRSGAGEVVTVEVVNRRILEEFFSARSGIQNAHLF